MPDERIKTKTQTKDNKEQDLDDNDEPESAFAGGGGWLNLVSPEGVVMIFCALILDITGLILLLFGLDDFGVTDIIGMLFIGGWAFLRFGTITLGQKAKSTGKRFIVSAIIEFIPWIGSLLPTWTIFVITELRKN